MQSYLFKKVIFVAGGWGGVKLGILFSKFETNLFKVIKLTYISCKKNKTKTATKIIKMVYSLIEIFKSVIKDALLRQQRFRYWPLV